MKIADREGNIIVNDSTSKSQKFLYNNFFGRIILKLLTLRFFSFLGGIYMNSFLSKRRAKKVIKKYKINTEIYEKSKYRNYNEFFTRKLKTVNFDQEENSFISPADSKLTVLEIKDDMVYKIKDSNYYITDILKDEKLSNEYLGGQMFIYRLEVLDYHRYIYIDQGKLLTNRKIKGRFHTVNPIAFRKNDVYKENSREYSVLQTKNFGKIIQIEVGALMVGKIKNYNLTEFDRATEKGMFLFGGSTVIVLTKKNSVKVSLDILTNSKKGFETIVKIGEKVGVKNEEVNKEN